MPGVSAMGTLDTVTPKCFGIAFLTESLRILSFSTRTHNLHSIHTLLHTSIFEFLISLIISSHKRYHDLSRAARGHVFPPPERRVAQPLVISPPTCFGRPKSATYGAPSPPCSSSPPFPSLAWCSLETLVLVDYSPPSLTLIPSQAFLAFFHRCTAIPLRSVLLLASFCSLALCIAFHFLLLVAAYSVTSLFFACLIS